MRAALRAAEDALAAGEAPIGSVIADANGIIIATGFNRMQSTKNATLHAEIVAFGNAAGLLQPGTPGYVMVSTLEPCVMCTGAAMECGISSIVYGLEAPADSGTGRVRPPSSPDASAPVIIGDVLADESRTLFVEWLAMHRGDASRDAQRKFIEQLLALTA